MFHIYILSLFEDTGRRAHVSRLKQVFNSKNIECTIVNAYYWKSHDIKQLLSARGFQYNPKLSLSQLACFLSHYHMWGLISKTSPDVYSIVLEDDMDITTEFNLNELERAIRSLEKPHDAILLWKHPEQAKNQPNPNKSYFSPFYYTWGLAAYLFTPKFARQLLDIKTVDMPVDEILLQQVYSKHTTYVAVKQHFKNLGLLGNIDYGPFMFKSNIWS